MLLYIPVLCFQNWKQKPCCYLVTVTSICCHLHAVNPRNPRNPPSLELFDDGDFERSQPGKTGQHRNRLPKVQDGSWDHVESHLGFSLSTISDIKQPKMSPLFGSEMLKWSVKPVKPIVLSLLSLVFSVWDTAKSLCLALQLCFYQSDNVELTMKLLSVLLRTLRTY